MKLTFEDFCFALCVAIAIGFGIWAFAAVFLAEGWL